MKGVGKGTGASTQMPGIKGEKGEKGDPGQRDMLDLTATVRIILLHSCTYLLSHCFPLRHLQEVQQ
jgi:hypothetical protein